MPSPNLRFFLIVAIVLAVLLSSVFSLTQAWQRTSLREAYLPQLEALSRRSPFDSGLLAVLGLRLAQANDPQAPAVLSRAIAAGEMYAPVWRVLAYAYANMGAADTAVKTLQLAQRDLGGTDVDINLALYRVQSLGPSPQPSQLIAAICPGGLDQTMSSYVGGSFFNSIWSYWGHLFPSRSGFSTRQDWAADQPNNAQAQRLWGLALLTNRRTPEALAVLSRATALAPNSAQTHLAYAQAFEVAGNFDQATVEYLSALNSRPNWLDALLGLGRSLTQTVPTYARLAFLKATRLSPSDTDAWIGLGRVDSKNGELEAEALSAFQTAQRLSPRRTDYFDDYAQVLYFNARQDDAVTILQQRLRVAPNDVDAHYWLGHVLLTGRPTAMGLSEALAQTRAGLQLSPGSARALEQLGQIQLLQGDTAAAIDSLQRALELYPEGIDAHRLLARAFAQARKPALAANQTALIARLATFQEESDVLDGQQSRRFLDPAYHREQAVVLSQLGETTAAAQQRQIALALVANPTGFAKSYLQFQSSLKSQLGPAGN